MMSPNDRQRNRLMFKHIENIIERENHASLMVLGDFNGHVGFIGEQSLNYNGQFILDLMQNYDLLMLNADPNCTGQPTWSRNTQRSTIDYILLNEMMYRSYANVDIDENKEVIDFSDHHLLHATFQVNTYIREERNESVELSYLKMTEETKEAYRLELQRRISVTENMSLQELEDEMKAAAEVTMRRKLKKTAAKDRSIERMWFTQEIKSEIGKRRQLNKCKRNAKTVEESLAYENLYKMQKQKVKNVVRETIMRHEKRVTDEIMEDKNRSKKVWEHIKKLQGRQRDETGNIVLFTANGTEVSREQMPEELEKEWKKI